MDPAPDRSIERDAEVRVFRIRFGGLEYSLHCRVTNRFHLGIRKARALQINNKVVAGQPSQFWQLNTPRTGWVFFASEPVGPVPAADVKWALADNRNLLETYDAGRAQRWEILQIIVPCYKCEIPCEKQSVYWHPYCGPGPQPGLLEKKSGWFFWTPICTACLTRFDTIFRTYDAEGRSFEGHHWAFLKRLDLEYLASQERSAVVRWVRNYVAPGKFTRAQFEYLCRQYGGICLRCGKRRPLVSDHIIPLAKGGSNDISNIQPLCARCNGIKSDKSTDYRKRRRKLAIPDI